MRISDWSSDVCSSDLLAVTRANAVWRCPLVNATGDEGGEVISKVGTYIQMSGGSGPDGLTIDANDNLVVCHVGFGAVWLFRSEEHTSELQSLMRISYAVFCLKKKKWLGNETQ